MNTLPIFPSSPIDNSKKIKSNESNFQACILIFFSQPEDGLSTRRSERETVGERETENNVTRNVYYAISWRRISIHRRRINESENQRGRGKKYIYIHMYLVWNTLDFLSRIRNIIATPFPRIVNNEIIFFPYFPEKRWTHGEREREKEIREGGRTSGRVIRGAPWGSPRQANPTNNRRRGRSRPAGWARSRSVWAGQSVEPRCSTRAYASARSRSSSSVARSPPFDGNDDSEPAEHPFPRNADNTCQFHLSFHAPHHEQGSFITHASPSSPPIHISDIFHFLSLEIIIRRIVEGDEAKRKDFSYLSSMEAGCRTGHRTYSWLPPPARHPPKRRPTNDDEHVTGESLKRSRLKILSLLTIKVT